MISTYVVAEFQSTDKSVEVTYFDENNFEYKRHVNIPRFEDNSIDEEYFQEILEGQLRGVENKIKLGMIVFKDPNEVLISPVGIGTT